MPLLKLVEYLKLVRSAEHNKQASRVGRQVGGRAGRESTVKWTGEQEGRQAGNQAEGGFSTGRSVMLLRQVPLIKAVKNPRFVCPALQALHFSAQCSQCAVSVQASKQVHVGSGVHGKVHFKIGTSR